MADSTHGYTLRAYRQSRNSLLLQPPASCYVTRGPDLLKLKTENKLRKDANCYSQLGGT